MFLYLMRHGEALQGADDSKRPLSERGRQEVAQIAKFLSQKKMPVDIIYHSTKQRAKETAEIVKDILNPHAVIETKTGLAPNDPIQEIFAEISRWKSNVMIVSHLPFLGKLVSFLVTGQEDADLGMPTASVVVLQNVSQIWTIQEIIYPEHLI